MKKILVIATGWHFSSHFYENMSKQILPDGWKVDYFCVAHREPEDENVIKEKENVRNSADENFLNQLDKEMYKYPITKKQIEDFGWRFMLEENTVCDMEAFNQWSEKFDYKDYDIICITHDDNFILSDNIFLDIVNETIFDYNLLTDDNFFSRVWHKTLGGTLPFIFQPDNTDANPSGFFLAKFVKNSIKVTQTSSKLYDISIDIEEV